MINRVSDYAKNHDPQGDASAKDIAVPRASSGLVSQTEHLLATLALTPDSLRWLRMSSAN